LCSKGFGNSRFTNSYSPEFVKKKAEIHRHDNTIKTASFGIDVAMEIMTMASTRSTANHLRAAVTRPPDGELNPTSPRQSQACIIYIRSFITFAPEKTTIELVNWSRSKFESIVITIGVSLLEKLDKAFWQRVDQFSSDVDHIARGE
jgi:hypothetical protein